MNPPAATGFLDVLLRNGHVHDEHARLEHLSGGVSSEIYLIDDGGNKSVVKRALPQLKVKDPWFADVGRNASERDYLQYVNRIMPDVVPRIHFSSAEDGYFGMEYLDGSYKNWKQLLLAGQFHTRHAELAGNILGEIHRRTASDEALRRQFDTTANFHQLRTEPYLLTTGARHPALELIFETEARRIESVREALVHGDFSPKNILIGDDRMVLLDCEVAWYGDPVFDVAFLLNHFFLKSLYHAPGARELAEMIGIFWSAYGRECLPGMAIKIESRLVPLLLMLMLARVDGKSPVEYLSHGKQRFIRDFVDRHLPLPPRSLAELSEIWFGAIAVAELKEAVQ